MKKMSDLDKELVRTARDTCLECEGVSSMASTLTSRMNETLKKSLTGIDAESEGVQMDREKTGLTFDLYLKVRYGEQIPVLAWNVQKSVTAALKEMTDENIKAVNIHIQGVTL